VLTAPKVNKGYRVQLALMERRVRRGQPVLMELRGQPVLMELRGQPVLMERRVRRGQPVLMERKDHRDLPELMGQLAFKDLRVNGVRGDLLLPAVRRFDGISLNAKPPLSLSGNNPMVWRLMAATYGSPTKMLTRCQRSMSLRMR
jgi:hypothetical protein